MGFVTFAQVVLGGPVSGAAAELWAAALGGVWRVADPAHGWAASLVPADADPVLHRAVGDAPTTLVLEVDDVAAASRRLFGLGATGSDQGVGEVALISPGGLPLALVAARSSTRPPVNRWPDGTSSRLVQVCLDCPPETAETEAEFWLAATGWSWQPCGSPEFVCHLVPDAGSLQLLVQRRDAAEPAGVTLHLDLGTSDREAEAARLVGLGAVRVATGRGWVVLADPDGRVFCATGLPPDVP